MLVLSTPSLPDGSAYRSSSLPSLHLQAKGSECSLTTRRRVAERTSPLERCCVGARNSSSGPCVLNPSIERNVEWLTSHFCAAAKVLHRWLRRRERRSSSPPVHNFGGTISAFSIQRPRSNCSVVPQLLAFPLPASPYPSFPDQSGGASRHVPKVTKDVPKFHRRPA